MRGALTRIYFGKRDSCILIKIRPHSRTQVLLWSVCWIRLELHSNMPKTTQLLKRGKMFGRSVEILLMAAGPYRPWLWDTGVWKWTFPKWVTSIQVTSLRCESPPQGSVPHDFFILIRWIWGKIMLSTLSRTIERRRIFFFTNNYKERASNALN